MGDTVVFDFAARGLFFAARKFRLSRVRMRHTEICSGAFDFYRIIGLLEVPSLHMSQRLRLSFEILRCNWGGIAGVNLYLMGRWPLRGVSFADFAMAVLTER